MANRVGELERWLHAQAHWRDFATVTFRQPTGLHAARCHWHHLNRTKGARVSYFAAFERNPGRPGYHIHALLAGLTCRRSELWEVFFRHCGRTRIEPIASAGFVLKYCTKYLCKNGEETWFDIKILGSGERKTLDTFRATCALSRS